MRKEMNSPKKKSLNASKTDLNPKGNQSQTSLQQPSLMSSKGETMQNSIRHSHVQSQENNELR